MSWRCWLGDTMTGLIDRPIDLPSFSWSVSVADSSLATNRQAGAGTEDWSGVTVPWTAISERTPEGRAAALSPLRRSLVLCWDDGSGGVGTPVLWGAIGQRSDSWLDTTFSVDSAMSMLSQRVAVPELAFGTGAGSTSPGRTTLVGSARSIMCQLVALCAGQKPGSALPIDLPYLSEAGSHSLELAHYDVGNLACSDLVSGLMSEDGGPDVQLRPYLYDSTHVRLRLVAGSDSEPGLPQGAISTLTFFPGGGTMQNLSADHVGPVQRVYATGSGTDEAQLCHLSEDLGLCMTADPWPLCESVAADSDLDSAASVAALGDGALAASSSPLVQLSCDVDLADPMVPAPGELWPGELVDLLVEGFPTLPGGTYRCRLQSMSGDQSTTVRLKFDPMADPIGG